MPRYLSFLTISRMVLCCARRKRVRTVESRCAAGKAVLERTIAIKSLTTLHYASFNVHRIVRAISTLAGLRRRQFCSVTALAACMAVAPAAAFAAPQVSGSSQAVSINAQNSSIKDVLSTLVQKFNLQFQSSTNLDKQLTGTYHGPLLQVVNRLLEGYNFIIRSNQDRLEVTVLGISGSGKNSQHGMRNGPASSNTANASASIAVKPTAVTTAPAQNTAPSFESVQQYLNQQSRLDRKELRGSRAA